MQCTGLYLGEVPLETGAEHARGHAGLEEGEDWSSLRAIFALQLAQDGESCTLLLGSRQNLRVGTRLLGSELHSSRYS